MLRRIHDPQRGASALEYAGLIVIAAALVITLANVAQTVGIGDRVSDAVQGMLRPGQQAPGAPGAAGGGDPDSTEGPSSARPTPGGGADGGAPQAQPAADPPSSPEEGEGDGGGGGFLDGVVSEGKRLVDGAANVVSTVWNWDYRRAVHGSAWDEVKSLGTLVTDPAGAARGIRDTVTNDTLSLVLSPETREAFKRGDWDAFGGHLAWDVVPWFTPGASVKALTKLAKLGKIGKAASKAPSRSGKKPGQQEADGQNNRGRGACNSFVPGTPVLLADGTRRPIEDVRPGARVLATNPTTGQTGARTVTDHITGTGTKTLVTIAIVADDGATDTITATDEHPFWAPQLREWVDAIDLEPGTWLQTSAGTWVQVRRLDTRTVRRQPAHNITVRDLRTYYVERGGTAVLVHNGGDSCPTFPNQRPDQLDDELAQAKRLGVEPVKVTDDGFDEVANSGRLKWAVTSEGELVVIPKWKGGQELSHTVLTRGRSVRAAGETEIAGSDGNYVGLEINSHSGHYQPSSESKEIGEEAFRRNGIDFQ